jgi:hypothetical protein
VLVRQHDAEDDRRHRAAAEAADQIGEKIDKLRPAAAHDSERNSRIQSTA